MKKNIFILTFATLIFSQRLFPMLKETDQSNLNSLVKPKLIICGLYGVLCNLDKEYIKAEIWKTLNYWDTVKLGYTWFTTPNLSENYQDKLFKALSSIKFDEKEIPKNLPVCYADHRELPLLVRLFLLTDNKQKTEEYYKKALKIIDQNIDNSVNIKILKTSLQFLFDAKKMNSAMAMTGALDIIKQYKKTHKIILLANMSGSIFDNFITLEKTEKIRKVFDQKKDYFISGKINMLKPCSKFYKHVLKQYNAEPEKVVVIDCHKPHFDNAKKLGMKCVHFDVNKIKKFKKELANVLKK